MELEYLFDSAKKMYDAAELMGTITERLGVSPSIVRVDNSVGSIIVSFEKHDNELKKALNDLMGELLG